MVIGKELTYKYKNTSVKATKAVVREALQVAKQLGYTDDICRNIVNASTEGEVIRALITGRHQMTDR